MNMGLDKMLEQITKDSNAVFTQLIETAKLHEGSIVVLGCSTSEVGAAEGKRYFPCRSVL